VLVEAEELTRYYGNLLAVDHVSFAMDRGEIVGLLGPNGAGKTTTIRMLTGFLPATEGTARIAGLDVRDHSTEARRHIGYMPENNPLYPEMRAREYLAFRADLKGVPRKLRSRRIRECIALCSLEEVADQTIGTLSKGYRQRVGLADAMLGRPDVLILDEPTIGLDPNQVREVRTLIRDLSEQHTVLISTHILAEAEAICQRVLIIDRGRIVADDTPHALADRTLRGTVRVELRGDPEEVSAALRGIDGVEGIQHAGRDRWLRLEVACSPDVDVRERIYQTAVERGWPLRELSRTRASLEDVFHRITLGADEPEATADRGEQAP
jgi:ABC-2 type transport system ATP-binding protein